MFFINYFDNLGEWLSASGPDSDVAVSSRIRFVRNIKGAVFPHRATQEESIKIVNNIFDKTSNISFLQGAYNIELDSIQDLDREILVERHLISKDMLNKKATGVIFDKKEIVSIMINEEDHIRMQCLYSGLNLIEAYRILSRIDDDISKNIEYAFHPDFGYLSACPTNAGTGLRASVLLHLPALVISEQIGKILKALGQMSLAIRGFYGEGTEALGNFFQVSNQQTLGKTEEDIIESVENITKNLIQKEREVRENLLKNSRIKTEDNIYRALGILSNARLISSKETMQHLSMVRMGIDMGLIKKIKIKNLNQLLILIQPSHLLKYSNINNKDAVTRNKIRAEVIRNKFGIKFA